MVTSKKHVPFGSSQKRFGKMTSHPNLDPCGLYANRPPACDPCLYHPKPLHLIFEVNKQKEKGKDPWRYKKELEEWAANLGYRNQAILDYRRWQNSILGPAWTEVHEPEPYRPACMNVGFGRTTRSKKIKNNTPGPGTYYSATPYKVPYGPHSKRPTFERDEPCRFKDLSPNWSLAPNRYNIIDKGSIEQKSKKVVSLRGPYDLFTGNRDGSTIKNHFNTSLRCSAATWPIALKGTLNKYEKSHFGRMNKSNRSKPHRGRGALVDLAMAVRRGDEPGPADHHVEKPRVFVQNKFGFNSSYDRPPGYLRATVWPAVGRYTVRAPRCGVPGHGHRHVFLSKEQRTIGAVLPSPMNSF